MSEAEQDKVIADLVRRKHALRRDVGCLRADIKLMLPGLFALWEVLEDEAWDSLKLLGNTAIAIEPNKPEQPHRIALEDHSPRAVVNKVIELVQKEKEIAELERSLRRCLGDE